MQKQKPLRSKKLRDSAKGERCTFRIPGVCNDNPETTVLCHLPDESGTGKMGGKVDDWCAAFGCSDCHKAIDEHWHTWYGGHGEPSMGLEIERDTQIHNAMLRTWRRWIEMGLIEIK